jgi:hypothetical protein
VDVFIRYGNNFWAPTIQPFIEQSIVFDRINKKIMISKPNLNLKVQSKPAPYVSPVCNSKLPSAPCESFIRVYITWG